MKVPVPAPVIIAPVMIVERKAGVNPSPSVVDLELDIPT